MESNNKITFSYYCIVKSIWGEKAESSFLEAAKKGTAQAVTSGRAYRNMRLEPNQEKFKNEDKGDIGLLFLGERSASRPEWDIYIDGPLEWLANKSNSYVIFILSQKEQSAYADQTRWKQNNPKINLENVCFITVSSETWNSNNPMIPEMEQQKLQDFLKQKLEPITSTFSTAVQKTETTVVLPSASKPIQDQPAKITSNSIAPQAIRETKPKVSLTASMIETVKTKLHDLKAIQTSIISLQTIQDNQTKSDFINAFVPLLQKQLQPADAFLKVISHEHQSICHTSNDIEVLVKELDLVIKQLAAHVNIF